MKDRKSGIELLRIIGLLLLVWVHDNTNKFGLSFGQFEYIVKDFIPIMTVNIFIMISSLYYDRLDGRWFTFLKKLILFHLITTFLRIIINIYLNGGYYSDAYKLVFGMSWYARHYLITLVLISIYRIKISLNLSLIIGAILFLTPLIIWWINIINLNIFMLKTGSGSIIQVKWLFDFPNYSFILIYSLIIIGNPIINVVKKWSNKNIAITFMSLALIKITLDYISIINFGDSFQSRSYSNPFIVFMPILIVCYFNNLNISSKKINKLGSISLLAFLLESRIGFFVRERVFTSYGTLNYILSIITTFIFVMTLAYLIQMIIDYINSRIKKQNLPN